MYIAVGQGHTTPPGYKILMSIQTSCHFGHLLQVSKKSVESFFFYTIFFMILFIYVYSPRDGADNPLGTKFWCQQEHLVTLVICCKFQKKSLWSLILYNFFHDFIHVYSARAGADSPQKKFWCQQKCLITSFIWCKFKKKCLWSLILYNFFHDLTHVYSPQGRGRQPPRDKILMSTERFYHFTHLLQVSKKSLWSLILYNFFHD